jgi:sugar-specific transcriptional regulator TrmB
MADQNKFEEMLERLINEDKEGAEELFHEIVVEKSRDIYESLLESDLDEIEESDDDEVDESEEEVDESDDEDLDEADDEEVDESEEEVDEAFDLDSFEVEADDEPEMDMDMDMGDDDEGEEGEELEDRVMDLEDALDDLKAEFEKMMSDEDGDDEEGDDDMDAADDMMNDVEDEAMAFEADDEEVDESEEEVDEAADEEVEETRKPKNANEQMREYVEKVTATMGDTGTNGTKSAVAGKNDMGGTAGNIAQAKDGGHPEAGAGSTVQGSALSDTSAKEDSAGNVNVPGGKASKSMKSQPGHGAEKKGKPETADKAATSTLNKVSTRAK